MKFKDLNIGDIFYIVNEFQGSATKIYMKIKNTDSSTACVDLRSGIVREISITEVQKIKGFTCHSKKTNIMETKNV